MSTNNHLPQPPNTTEYEFRPARLEDAPAIHRTQIAIDAHDSREWAGTLADTEKNFEDPATDAATGSLIALTPESDVAALGWVFAPKKVENKHRAYLWLDVHPRHRANGLKDFMLEWAEARARQILAERPLNLPHAIRSGCMDNDPYKITMLEQHGYQPVRHFFTMRRDLDQPIADVALPPDVTIRPWGLDVDERTFEASNDAFQDHWGFEPETKEIWDLFYTGSESFRGDLSFVIMAGDKVVGFSLNYLSPEENERNGIQEAWVGELAVRRPWRKRGFATALLNQSMHAFEAEGLDYATLGVDTENPTGALGVYERVGFAPVKRSISFAKTIHEPQ